MNESRVSKPSFSLTGVLVAASVALAATCVWYYVLRVPTQEPIAAYSDTYPGLTLRELADSGWSEPRSWSGDWSDVSPEASRIIVAADGFVPAVYRVEAHRGLILPPLKRSARLSAAVIGPERSVVVGETVTATRAVDNPVSAELLEFYPFMGVQQISKTDDNGLVELMLLPETNYTITLPSDTVEELGIVYRSTQATLAPGETKHIVFSPVTAAESLAGWIETPTGEPCTNARVALRSKQDGGNVILNEDLLVTRTGPNGAFILEGKVPAPRVRMESRDPSTIEYSLWVEWTSPDDRKVRGYWPVEPWEGRSELGRMTLPQNVSVTVSVTQGGQPLPGARVRICVASQLEMDAITDEAGHALFEGLPAMLDADCIVESPDMIRGKADLTSAMKEGGTITVALESPWLPATKVGTATIKFDRAAHGIASDKKIIFKCQYYEPGTPRRRTALGGGWDIPAGADSVELPAGHCMVYGCVNLTKLVTQPHYLHLRGGETYEFKAVFEEWGELLVDTDVPKDVASVYVGIKTLEGLHIDGDIELTGVFTKRKGPFKLRIPPHGEYKARIYAEPMGVPRGPMTRKWHEIELEPFKPGEVRRITIQQWWQDDE